MASISILFRQLGLGGRIARLRPRPALECNHPPIVHGRGTISVVAAAPQRLGQFPRPLPSSSSLLQHPCLRRHAPRCAHTNARPPFKKGVAASEHEDVEEEAEEEEEEEKVKGGIQRGNVVEEDGDEEGQVLELTADQLEAFHAEQASAMRGAVGDVARLVCGWARDHVLHHRLCPFAKSALLSGACRLVVEPEVIDPRSAANIIYKEAMRMSACQEGEIATTLLAFPSMYPDDFGKWHQFVEALEDMMDRDDRGVGHEVLVAAFHPMFEFQGLSGEETALNFEKRSPVPVINLLRAAGVDAAIDSGFKAETLQGRNGETLVAAGTDNLGEAFDGLEPLDLSVEEWCSPGEEEYEFASNVYRVSKEADWGN